MAKSCHLRSAKIDFVLERRPESSSQERLPLSDTCSRVPCYPPLTSAMCCPGVGRATHVLASLRTAGLAGCSAVHIRIKSRYFQFAHSMAERQDGDMAQSGA